MRRSNSSITTGYSLLDGNYTKISDWGKKKREEKKTTQTSLSCVESSDLLAYQALVPIEDLANMWLRAQAQAERIVTVTVIIDYILTV